MKRAVIVTLAASVFVIAAFSYLQPQGLKRDIKSDLELLPAENVRQVVVFPSFDATMKKLRSKEWFKRAESNGLLQDFYDYVAFRAGLNGLPLKAVKLLKGKPIRDLIGDQLIIAYYRDGGEVYITHPREYLQMSWREVVKDGQKFTHAGYDYYRMSERDFISFMGDIMVITTSEQLMWNVLDRAAAPEESVAELALPHKIGSYIYGYAVLDGKLLVGTARFVVTPQGIDVEIENPDGFIGRTFAEAKPAGKLRIAPNTAVRIRFSKVDFSKGEDFLETAYTSYRKALEDRGIRPIYSMFKGEFDIIIDGFTKDYYSVPKFAMKIGVRRKDRGEIGDVIRDYIDPDQTLVDWSLESGKLYIWNAPALKNAIDSKRGRTLKKRGMFMYLNSGRLMSQLSDYMVHVSRYSDNVDGMAVRDKLTEVIPLMGGPNYVGMILTGKDMMKISIRRTE